MATYTELLLSQKPKLLAQFNGTDFTDLTGKASFTQNDATYSVEAMFPHTSMDTSARLNQSSGAPGTFQFTPSSNKVTMSFWMRCDSQPFESPSHSLMSLGDAKIHFFFHSTGVFGVNTYNADTHGVTSDLVFDKKWHHYTFAFDMEDVSGTVRVWVDGVERTVSHTATSAPRTVSGSAQTFRLGCAYNGSVSNFVTGEAQVSTIAYFDRILTDAEIESQWAAHPNTEFGDELSNLIALKNPDAWYKFLYDDTGTTVSDHGGSGYDMTITGGYVRGQDNTLHLTPMSGYTSTAPNNDVGDMTAPLAYELWLEFKSFPSDVAFIGHANSVDNWGEGLQIGAGGIGTFLQFSGTQSNSGKFKLKLNTKHHIVLVRDTAGRKLYLDGQHVFTLNDTNNPIYTTGPLVINKNWSSQATNNRHQLDAKLHEFVLHTDALSAEDVLAHYNAGMGIVASEEPTYEDIVLAGNPVAFFPFGNMESDSTTQLDVSGNNRHMTISSGAIVTTGGGLGGKPYYSHPSTGTTDAANCYIPSGITKYTVEVWHKRTGLAANGYNLPLSVSNGSYIIDIDDRSDANELYVYTQGAAGGTAGILAATLPQDEWLHLALTVDHEVGEISLYVNGVIIQTRDAGITVVPSNTRFGIGTRVGQAQYPSPGAYQYPACYDRLLTPEEIREHYEFFAPVVSSVNTDYTALVMQNNPIAYYPCEFVPAYMASATLLFDASGNGHHMSYNPTASVTGVGSGSVVDTGINDEPAFHCNGNALNVAIPELEGKQQITIEGWFHSNKASSDAFYDVPFTVEDTATSNNYAFYGAINNTTGANTFNTATYHIAYANATQWSGNSNYVQKSGGNMIQTWRHICITADLSTGKSTLWVDGEPVYVTNGAAGHSFTATMGLALCGRTNSIDRDCKIQHAALYDTILTRDEIKARVNMYREALNRPDIEADYKSKVLEKNPLVYLTGDSGVSNEQLLDISGNGRHPKQLITSSAVHGTVSNTGLNETPAYLTSKNASSPQLFSEVGTLAELGSPTVFTVEGWFKFNVIDGDFQSVFGLGDSADGNFRAYLTWNGNTGFSALYGFYGSNLGTSPGTGYMNCPPVIGRWYHGALVIDLANGSIKSYINGNLCGVDVFPAGTPSISMVRLWVNCRPNQSTFAYGGETQHIAVYDRALTEVELREHFELRVPESEFDEGTYEASVMADNPLNYWILDDVTGSKAKDYASGMHGTINGSSADQMKTTGLNYFLNPEQSAMKFSGSQWIDIGDPTNFIVNNEFTIEVLFELKHSGSAENIVSMIDASGFQIAKTGAEAIAVSVRNEADTAYLDVTTMDGMPEGVYHLALTFTGTAFTTYVNGQNIGTITVASGYKFGWTAGEKTQMAIGCNWNVSGTHQSFFTGKAGHVALYDHVVPLANLRARAAMILGPTVGVSYQDVVLADTPYMYAPLNGQTSGVIHDLAFTGGKFRHGRVYNNTLDSYDFDSEGIVANGGGSLLYDGVNRAPDILYWDDEDIALVGSSNVVTWELWVKPIELVGASLLQSGSSGETLATNYFIQITWGSGGAMSYFWEYGSGTNESGTLFPAGTIEVGKTYHIVIVRGSNFIKGYLNGKLLANITGLTKPDIGTSPTAGNRLMLLGHRDYASEMDNHCNIAHFAMYDYALGYDRILEHYLVGTGVDTTSVEYLSRTALPTAYYTMTNGVVMNEADGSTYGTIPNRTSPASGLYKGSPGATRFSGVPTSAWRVGDTTFSGKTIGCIEMWVQLDGTREGQNEYFYSATGGDTSTSWVLLLAKAADGNLVANWYGAGASIKSSVPVPIGAPVHVAYVRDNLTHKLYMNGEEVATGACAATAFATQTHSGFGLFSLSAYQATYDYFYMEGVIDNVLLESSRAWTAAEIKARYQAGAQGTYFERFLNGNNCTFYAPFNEMPPVDKRTGQAATLSTGGTVELVDGVKSSKALAITSPGEISFADKPQYDPYTNGFTVAIWAKFNGSTGASQRLIEKKGLGTAEGWQLCTGHNGDEDFGNSFIIGDSLVQHRFSTNESLPYTLFDSEWHHIAMVLDRVASKAYLYVDGQLTETISHAELATVNVDNAGYDLHIGGAADDSSQQFNGELDEAMIFKKALSQTEIKQLVRFSEPGYKVTGNVTYDNNPAERTVRVYNRASGELVSTVMSNANTGVFEAEWNDIDPDNQYYVVVMDDTPKPDLDPLVKDRVNAEVIEEL